MLWIAALFLAATSVPTYADYSSKCAGCHAASASPEVDNLPNGTGTSGSIRAANNRTYLDTKITAGMGNFTGLSGGANPLSAAQRDAIVAEIRNSNSVAIPVITSTAPPGGNYNSSYSKTITATSAPSLNGPHLPSAFTLSSGTFPPGLTINGQTGVLSGTPTNANFETPYTGVIRVDNKVGTDTQAFSIVITRDTQTITFPAQSVTARTFVPGGTFSVSPTATSTSGLAITYTSDFTTNCTISGTTVTMVSAGSCTIRANRDASSNYEAAVDKTQTVTINPGNPNINLPLQSPSTQAFRPNTTFVVNPIATSPSPVAITYLATPPSVCTNVGTTITKVGIGNCAIVASQVSNADWNADDSLTRTVIISQAVQVLTFPVQVPASYTFTAGATFAIDPATSSAATSSGNPIVYSSLTTGVCTVSGTTVTMVNAGTCTLAANQLGNVNYANAAQATQNVTLAAGVPGAPTIISAIGGNQRATVMFTPPANPGSPITVLTATCVNAALTRIGTGAASPVVVTALTNVAGWTCSVTATNAVGTGGASSALAVSPTPSATLVVPIIRSSNNATLTTGTNGSFQVVATGTLDPVISRSGVALPSAVAFTTVGQLAGTGLMSGTPALGSAAGSPYVFTFTAANASGPNNQTFTLTIAKAAQTITFPDPADRPYSDSDFALTAASTSGLAVSYTSSTPSNCTIVGTMVNMVTVGTCTINADQAGDADYNAATPVPQSFQITQATQSITWEPQPLPNRTFVDNGTFALSPLASASSGLPVSYASNTPAVCSIAGTTVTMLAAGTCILVASQDGNANYQPQGDVQRGFTIIKADQTIIFPAQSAQPFSVGGTFPINPLASGGASGLPVTYTSTTTGVCTIVGTTVTIVTVGICTVAANQAGDSDYNAATQVTRNIAINAVVPGAPTADSAVGSDAKATIEITPPAFSGGSTITGYTATCNPGNIQGVSAGSPVVVFGLANTVPHTCTVVANNAAGSSAPSNPIDVTPVLDTGVNLWTNVCTACHAGLPSGARFNAAGQTGAVINYVRANQASMLTSATVQALTLNELAEIAKYIETFVPAISANTAFNNGVGVDVTSHLTLGTVSFTSAVAVTPPANGTLSAFTGTQVTYTPNPGFVGMDTFTYRGTGNAPMVSGDPRTVTITVAPPPPPTITSPAIASGVFNTAFAYQISATNSPTSYGAAPLGVNFTIDTMTGLVSGTPMTTGNFTVTASATNAGGTGMQVVMITISPASQTITFGTQGGQPFSPNGMFALSPVATASSGLAVTYTSLTSGVCSIGGTTVTILTAGNCTIAADQAGNANYNAALQVTRSIAISATAPGSPTIGAATPGDASAAIAFAPPASNGGSVITGYTATCSASGQTTRTGSASTTPITVGTVPLPMANGVQYACSVVATNAMGNSGASGTVMVTPTATPVPPLFTSAVATTFTVLSAGNFNVTATGTPAPVITHSGGALPAGVTFGAGVLSGTPATLTAVGGPYPLTFTATNGSGSVMQSFTLTVQKASQSISFTGPPSQPFTPSTIPLTASASPSLLGVTFTSNTLPVCTVSGATLTLLTVGTCSITAGQPGNADYNAATGVTQGFTVSQAAQAISFPAQTTASRNFVAGNPFAINPTATAASGLTVAYSSTTPSICSVVGTTVTMVAPGTCTIAANQSGSPNYLAAPQVTRNVSLNATAPGAPTIGAATPGNGQATIAFTPPSNNGGSAITGYTATCNVGGFTGNNAASPVVVPGLTNGVNYTCSVTATNGIGTSVASGTVLVTPLSGQGATLWTDKCDVCHTSLPSGTQLNGAGTTATVINYVRGNQPSMAVNAGVQALTLSDLADIATYIAANVPPNDVTATRNTPVMVNVNNHITLTNQVWSAFTTIEVVTGPANGTLGAFSGTQIQYTPANGYTGTDSFTYRGKRTGGIAYDGDARTVNITVNPPAPVITSSTSASGTFGVAFNYQITASNTPTSFDATGLPGGLGVSTVSGAITGTASETGSFTVALTANNAGGTGGATLTLQIDPAPQVITFPPQTTASRPFAAGGSFAISPIATSSGASGNPIDYGSGNSAVCTVSGTTVTIVSAGTCVITANQAGNSNHAAASQATQNVAIIAIVPGAPGIGAATAGNGQASIAFTPPASNGGSAITGYTATCNPGGVTGTGGGSPVIVTGLTNGIGYTCAVTASNLAGTGAASGTVAVTPASLMFTGVVVSRKTHGGLDFNVPITVGVPITDAVSVEPRSIGAGHRIVFQFDNPVTSVTSVTAIDKLGNSIGTATPSFPGGNELIVTLSGITDNTRVTVTVTGANGAVNASASMGFLVGDVNGTRSVNAADISAVKANLNLPAGAGNFRMDSNASGTVTSADVSAVKARAGLVLP